MHHGRLPAGADENGTPMALIQGISTPRHKEQRISKALRLGVVVAI